MFHVDYDAIAATYDRRYEENNYSGVENAVSAFVAPEVFGRVLEVGCGTGHWLRMLEERRVRAAGVDASREMLVHARVLAPHAALARSRAEHLPWANGVFERLFCVNAFHHFDDKAGFLAEARRVLVPGGRVMTIGLDPHGGLDQWYVYDYFESVLSIDKQRYPAASQIREWMRELLFSDVRTFEVQHLPARLLAREALERGRLSKGAKSQLAVLTDEEYRKGVDRIWAAVSAAEALGEPLFLHADLRLYASVGTVPA